MRPRLPAPLRLVFGRRRRPVEEHGISEAIVPPPEVEFVAYGEDCLLSGHLVLPTDRLTDLLNEHDAYVLIDVLVESLVDGSGIEVHELAISRDEILLVHATGPRGNPERRQRTRQHPIAAQLGPYHVRGYLHALPGSDPIESIRRRKAMVPLTDAWVEYGVHGIRQRRHVSSLVINREQLDWVIETTDEEIEFPELPVGEDAKGPLVKDFTGHVLSDRVDEADGQAIA